MPARPVPVHYELAADVRFRRIVRTGTELALPSEGHSVHVDVRGLLPGRNYFYRFWAGSHPSPIGYTRTAPAAHDRHGRIRFAVSSCQDYEDGYYTAYGRMLADDLDFVLFLGDYIYEGSPSDDKPRRHDGVGEPVTLDEYRARHALYKTDPELQAAHAAFPWLVTFDDHEVDNDWSGENPQDPDKQSREQFLARRAAAFQAYWEHMPLRRSSHPQGDDVSLYRRLSFGALADVHVLDTRQYRSLTEPCGYGTGPVCDAVLDPSRTMLGDQQEQWLYRGIARSEARWNLIAQQVPVTRIDVGPPGEIELKLDKWDAYPVARQRLLNFLGAQRRKNPVVLTGDLHDSWAALLKRDFDDPSSEVVAPEFIGMSITSDGNGGEVSEDGELALPKNPHLLFHNNLRGYLQCELDSRSMRTEFRVLPYVEEPDAPLSTRASFVVEQGNPVPQED
jgi:alkaline phosphatase D